MALLRAPIGRSASLLQANAEAVRRHYGLADPERPALAITAYLISRDIGVLLAGSRPSVPGVSDRRDQRPFAEKCW